MGDGSLAGGVWNPRNLLITAGWYFDAIAAVERREKWD
jgi:hypothetical protein